MPRLFHQILNAYHSSDADVLALEHKSNQLTYAQVNQQVNSLAGALVKWGLQSGDRVAVYLPKQFESVISYFATSKASGIFVPVNPLLKGPQVQHILSDCEVRVLITSKSRYQQLRDYLTALKHLEAIILVDGDTEQLPGQCHQWQSFVEIAGDESNTSWQNKSISQDIAAILYTSGSTGKPKGVVLSHQNLISGAKSVAEYLNNHEKDKLLAVLPFSFDYGLSQITTAFISGASLVLMEYLLPRDVINAVVKYRITGLAAVPPLWVQLAEMEWPQEAQKSLRYFTNSGGAMPQATIEKLQQQLPDSLAYLMYGLTEAFRSTYLPPDQLTERPTSMGKAIPDAEILVLNEKGEECLPGEEGELVHRGPHVALGYWNAPEKTQQRFKPLPRTLVDGLTDEIAVWSGDTVVSDEEGFLYFVGRKDDMIKSSGYRISPAEIEEVVYAFEDIIEVAAIGVPEAKLGQAVVLVIQVRDKQTFDEKLLLKYCQKNLPNFMQPKAIQLLEILPKNPNGKINRRELLENFSHLFTTDN